MRVLFLRATQVLSWLGFYMYTRKCKCKRKGDNTMATVADDIAKISTDSAALATAQGTLVAAQNAIAPLQTAVDTAQGTVSADNAQVSADLQAKGPAVEVNPDGSYAIWIYSTTAPGFQILTGQPAGSLTSVTPTPAPTPPPPPSA